MWSPAEQRKRRQQALQRHRLRGRRGFILHVGVLRFGLAVWLFVSLTHPLIRLWLHDEPIPSPGRWATRALIGLPVWLAVGYFVGAREWKRSAP